MKFGLRIHWGEYAIDGEHNPSHHHLISRDLSVRLLVLSAIGPESWPLNNAKGNQSFLNWYWHQNKTWNPSKYCELQYKCRFFSIFY